MEKGKLNLEKIDKVTAQWIQDIGCVASSTKVPIKTLSGGNAQKMVIAKWLNTHPKLLILNGPTVGVDIGSKFDIHEILHNLAATGVGVIIITDDLSELYYNCNKLIIMSNGFSSGVLAMKDYSETQISEMIKKATKELKE
jgi:simple sugar transport system ATP-binding protein